MPQYPYYPVDKPALVNWPKAILWGMTIGLSIAVIIFFILDPLNLISKKASDLLNQDNNQGPGGGIVPNFVCGSDVYNCGNFTTHRDAQNAYNYCLSQGKGDIHQLDSDGDGIVCEGLP